MATLTGIDPQIFQTVQEQIEKDNAVRDDIREALKKLDRRVRQITSILSRVHSKAPAEIPNVAKASSEHFASAKEELKGLAKAAEGNPYYKYNQIWTRDLQNLTFLVLFKGWLGRTYAGGGENGLLTIQEVGEVLEIPVNLKTEDRFHLTVEEYLHAVITLVEETSRLIVNAVNQLDYERPEVISSFVKDVHASFQLLNLKNDTLRRRSDGLKYNVKKVEDVLYDLRLRNLIQPVHSKEAHEV
ncbi:Translin-1 [Rhizina undulata]